MVRPLSHVTVLCARPYLENALTARHNSASSVAARSRSRPETWLLSSGYPNSIGVASNGNTVLGHVRFAIPLHLTGTSKSWPREAVPPTSSQHHRSDELRRVHGHVDDHLATDRVGHDHGSSPARRQHPIRKGGREASDIKGVRRAFGSAEPATPSAAPPLCDCDPGDRRTG